jgi:hypothetical protein
MPESFSFLPVRCGTDGLEVRRTKNEANQRGLTPLDDDTKKPKESLGIVLI